MEKLGKRAWLTVATGLLAVPVVTAGIAYACTGLATVSSDPGAAAPGATVTVTGKGFLAHDPTDVRTSPALIRLDTMEGPVIGSASPSGSAAGGSFSVPVTIPQVAAGDHVLVVTQNAANGAPAYGTPARQAFTVLAPAVAAAAPVVETAPLGTVPVAIQQAPAATQNVVAKAAPKKLSALQKAIATCNSRYAAKKAKTRAGRARLLSRRLACRSRAARRHRS